MKTSTQLTLPKRRRTLSVILTALLTSILILTGGATPALAATKISSIPLTDTFSHNGNTIFYGKTAKFSPGWSGYSYTTGQQAKLTLQRKVGTGSWTNISTKTITLPLTTDKTTFTAPAYSSKNAKTTISYRIASVASTDVAKTTYSKPVTLTYAYKYPAGIPITDLLYNNVQFNRTLNHPNKVPIKFHINFKQFSYYAGDKAKFTLQRKIGTGKWANVASMDVDLAKTKAYTITAPAYATSKATETVYYRVHSSTTSTVDKATTTREFKVVYVNQSKYTGLAKTYYDMAKQYCPNTVIRIVKDLTSGGRKVAGYYTTYTSEISVSSGVEKYSTADRKSVLSHECGHYKQYAMTSNPAPIMKKYFVNDSGKNAPAVKNFDALEHAADCAAKSVNPNGYLGYGGYCNSKELAYGKKIMAGTKWW